MAQFECTVCGFSKQAPDEWLNRRAVCPKCKNKSVISSADIVITDALEFDETKTFAYKGDYLGMAEDLFLQRHDDPNNEEFGYVSSKDSKCDDLGFDEWMHATVRLVQYSVTGTRLTIVGFPLRHAVFTFLDGTLSTIGLKLRETDSNTWAEILPQLHQALPDPTEDNTPVEFFVITTWLRPLARLSLVYGSLPGFESIDVRYVNTESMDTLNRLRTSTTGSKDL